MIETGVIIKLVLAVLLGGIIGWERETSHRAAGLRTHILVCLGATLVTISSLMFGDNADPSRIAANVVVGIGFIGAGVILKGKKEIVRGLTTAASLWLIAIIGLALGIGFYIGAIVTTILAFFVLKIDDFFDIKGKNANKEIKSDKTR